MDKLKLNKVETAEVRALNQAKETLENARQDLENARQDLETSKNSKAKNRASIVGNSYIALLEAENAYNEAENAYNEAENKFKGNIIQFPKNDSKSEWEKLGLSKEYAVISTWYTITDSILETMRIAKSIDTVTKEDIKAYFRAYCHQVTNANDLIKFGYLNEDSNIIVKHNSNYAFRDTEARQCQEAKEAKQKAIEEFNEVFNALIDTFIE